MVVKQYEFDRLLKVIMNDGFVFRSPGVFMKETQFKLEQHKMLQDQSLKERKDYLQEVFKYAVIK